jgi:hypothetical protein
VPTPKQPATGGAKRTYPTGNNARDAKRYRTVTLPNGKTVQVAIVRNTKKG